MLMYISSADFMTRNLNRRVEVACPIKDRAVKAQIWEILQLMLSDNVKARTMDCRGIYRKKERRAGRRLSERAEEESRPSSRITCIIRSSCSADSAGLASPTGPAGPADLADLADLCRHRQYSQAAVSQVNRPKQLPM